jgi:hypothetical protein
MKFYFSICQLTSELVRAIFFSVFAEIIFQIVQIFDDCETCGVKRESKNF